MVFLLKGGGKKICFCYLPFTFAIFFLFFSLPFKLAPQFVENRQAIFLNWRRLFGKGVPGERRRRFYFFFFFIYFSASFYAAKGRQPVDRIIMYI